MLPNGTSRTLSSPTEDDFVNLKHTIRYLKGTEDYGVSIVPKDVADDEDTFDVTTFADSDWAGCTTTTTSATECAIHHARCRSTSLLRILFGRGRTLWAELRHNRNYGRASVSVFGFPSRAPDSGDPMGCLSALGCLCLPRSVVVCVGPGVMCMPARAPGVRGLRLAQEPREVAPPAASESSSHRARAPVRALARVCGSAQPRRLGHGGASSAPAASAALEAVASRPALLRLRRRCGGPAHPRPAAGRGVARTPRWR